MVKHQQANALVKVSNTNSSANQSGGSQVQYYDDIKIKAPNPLRILEVDKIDRPNITKHNQVIDAINANTTVSQIGVLNSASRPNPVSNFLLEQLEGSKHIRRLPKSKRPQLPKKKRHMICPQGRDCTHRFTCPYAHSQEEVRNRNNYKLRRAKQCVLYQRGLCHLGSACKMYHGNMDIKGWYRYQLMECPFKFQTQCPYGRMCVHKHVPGPIEGEEGDAPQLSQGQGDKEMDNEESMGSQVGNADPNTINQTQTMRAVAKPQAMRHPDLTPPPIPRPYELSLVGRKTNIDTVSHLANKNIPSVDDFGMKTNPEAQLLQPNQQKQSFSANDFLNEMLSLKDESNNVAHQKPKPAVSIRKRPAIASMSAINSSPSTNTHQSSLLSNKSNGGIKIVQVTQEKIQGSILWNNNNSQKK